MSSPPPSNAKSPLDAAQKIVAELSDLPAEHQLLAMKFASETLGLKLQTVSPPATVEAASPPIRIASAIGTEHSTDIRTFTAMKAPKSDQQFCAVVAYFYQFEARPSEKKLEIDAEVMKEAARLAGRPQVERWGMTLNNAKNAGYLDAAGAGSFKLSSVGENLVAITLPSGDSSGAPKGARKASPRYKKRVIKKKPSKRNSSK